MYLFHAKRRDDLQFSQATFLHRVSGRRQERGKDLAPFSSQDEQAVLPACVWNF